MPETVTGPRAEIAFNFFGDRMVIRLVEERSAMIPGHQQTVGKLQTLHNIIIHNLPEGSNTIRALLPDLARFWSFIVTAVSKTDSE